MSSWWRRLRYLCNRQQFDADLAEELAFHHERATQDLEQAGHGPAEAARGAWLTFGSHALTSDQARDIWVPAGLRDLSYDIRSAVRVSLKDLWFTAVVVGTLALAIGFNATLYTIVIGMGGTFPVADPARVVTLGSLDPNGRKIAVSYLDLEDWRILSTLFDTIAAYSTAALTITDRGLAAERVSGAYISSATFTIIGQRPILGRDFRPEDDRAGAARVVILGASIWKHRYDSDAGIVGRVITVNGVPLTVVGVMPEGFRFPLVHDLWQPISADPAILTDSRDVRRLDVLAHLTEGVGMAQARAALETVASRLSTIYATTNAGVRSRVEPIGGEIDLTNPWHAMVGGVSIVFLIACANIANLLLARAASRSHEFAIRTSLGATRWRIVRQLFVESGVLATLGGMGGWLAASLGVRLWLASMPDAQWPYWFHFAIDYRVSLYLAVVSVGSVLLFGVGPALYVAKRSPSQPLKESGRSGTPAPRARRWTHVLLTVQFALTLSLLAGAGLLARTLLAVHEADAVLDPSPVILAGVNLPPQRYASPMARVAFYHDLEARVGAVPAIEAMALASEMPFYSAPVWSVTVEGAVFPHALGGPTTSYVLIGTRYFETLGLGPIRGRVFHDRDGTPGHETVIVNQLFASKYLAGRDPLGQRIRLTNPNRLADIAPWLTVVGVSPTVRQHYAQEIDPVVYVPYWVTPLAQMTVLTRTRTEAAALTPILREQLRQLDPDMPFVDIRPLTWLLSGTRFANRVAVAFFSLAAALGLLLAAVGLHAVTAHAIRQRTQEIGVRMALGAHASQIVWLFVRGMLAPLGWGVLLGILGALAVGRFVRGMLIQTSPTDPLTLVSIAVVLVVVALAATFRPARRGSRLDPVAALRCE